MSTILVLLLNAYLLGALVAWVSYWITGRWRSMPPGFARRLSIVGYMLLWPARLARLVAGHVSSNAPEADPPTDPHSFLPSLTPEELARIGFEAYGGSGGAYPGAQPSLVDPLVQQAFESIDYRTGTQHHEALTNQFLSALRDVGARSAPWGAVGAFLVAWNYVGDTEKSHPVYLGLAADALTVMRDHGVPAYVLPPFMRELWADFHPGVNW